jgi:hypothetical protein
VAADRPRWSPEVNSHGTWFDSRVHDSIPTEDKNSTSDRVDKILR